MARSTRWRGSSTRFRRELPEPNLTYNVGVIGGGTPAAIDAAGLARHRLGQDQHRRRDRHRPRRHPHAVGRAGAARPRTHAGDRRPAPAADRGRAGVRRGRLSADGADRGQPRAAGAAQRGQPRPRLARNAGIRPGPPRRRRQRLRRRATSTRWPASAWPAAAPMPKANGSTSTSLPRQAIRAAILMTRLARDAPPR